MIEAFSEVNRGDRFLVAKALGEIGPGSQEALPLIIQAMQDEDRRLQRVATDSLKKIAQ